MAEPPSERPPGIPTGGPSGRAAAPPVQRVRITFAKGPEIRFIGHLDVVRLWERAARRASVPLAYTLGFTPHPRFAFAAPLALGATGARERVDAYFTQEMALPELGERLQAQLPPGCRLVDLHEVALDAPAPMALMRWAEYRVDAAGGADGATGHLAPDQALQADATTEAPGTRWSRGAADAVPQRAAAGPTDEELAALAATGSPWRPAGQHLAPPLPPGPLPPLAEVQQRIDAFLAAEHVLQRRERQGKLTEHDIRPFVLDLWLSPTSSLITHDSSPNSSLTLGMLIRADASGAGRPEEVATAIGLHARRIHRVRVGLEGEQPPTTPRAVAPRSSRPLTPRPAAR